MKSVLLLFKLWRAGYRAARGLWWLTTVTVFSCFLLLIHFYLPPFIRARQSLYHNVQYRHTAVTRLGTLDEEDWQAVLSLLENSPVVDYYIPQKTLDTLALQRIPSLSTVVTTRISPFVWEKNKEFCDSRWGEPSVGHAYIDVDHFADGLLTLSPQETFTADTLTLTYTATLQGEDLFDVLISEEDFAALDRPITRLTYGISPFATKTAVVRLNQQLAALLPQARFDVSLKKDLDVGTRGGLFFDPIFFGVTAAALLAWYLLYRHTVDQRSRQLAVTRLLGCRCRLLFSLLIGEAVWNTLLTFAAAMGSYSLYRALFWDKTPLIALLLWGDVLPLCGILLLIGALFGAAAALRTVRCPLTSAGKGGVL